MLAELREYARSDPKPKDAPSVETMIDKLFERSILGTKVRVFANDGTTICRMTKGFEFFARWAKESEKDEDKRAFLAWQVNFQYTYKHLSNIFVHTHIHM